MRWGTTFTGRPLDGPTERAMMKLRMPSIVEVHQRDLAEVVVIETQMPDLRR